MTRITSCFSLAELGAIIVRMDTRGTGGRSRAFLEPAYKNLGEIGLDAHIHVLKTLAKRYTSFDLDRVGVLGYSAGGFDVVRALTRQPDFYKVGVSIAGNHDGRMDKAAWIEQWLGSNDPSVYDKNSNYGTASNLIGKLLLIHGEFDENVPVRASLGLAKHLYKAGKAFDMVILPDAGHNLYYIETHYQYIWDFFMRHLLQKEPPEFKMTKDKTITTFSSTF